MTQKPAPGTDSVSGLDTDLTVARDALDLGKVPLLVAKGADRPGPEPALDAVEMEDVAAIAEGNGQTIVIGRGWVGLILDGGLVEGVAADGAGVGANVPGPHGDRVPLLDLEAGRGWGLLLLGLFIIVSVN